VTTHAIQLNGLTEGTLYHFFVTSADASSNVATSTDQTFTTTIDITPPANVTLTATPGDTIVTLDWTLPGDPDFLGTKISARPAAILQDERWTLVYDGPATTRFDSGSPMNYILLRSISYDTHHNYASGALANATPSGPPIIIPPPSTTTPPVVPPTSTPPVVPPDRSDANPRCSAHHRALLHG